jgi:putative restriction endonuclease
MSNGTRKPWTRGELILAINLYCKTPFGRIHNRNPDIVALAAKLDRSPSSVSYKLASFASIDPTLNRKGADHTSRLDQEVWNEFFADWDAMAYESERLSSQVQGTKIELPDDETMLPLEGKTREAIVMARVNQSFFRKMILASYDGACCITGLAVPELLVASHIVPWSKDPENRMNPRNGLCLNALHDKAFDMGLITINEEFRVVVSSVLSSLPRPESHHELISKYAGSRMALPQKFLPDQALLDFHRQHIFRA